MLIYFSASARNIEKDIELYHQITNRVKALGHTIANEWIDTRQVNAIEMWDMQSIVHDSLVGIESSEILIAEASGGSALGVGYEIGYALQLKKPVLVLVSKDHARDSYISGLKHELLTYKKYAPEDLDKIITKFIQDNVIKNKDLRFNFVIDRQLYNHIRWKSFKTHKTKAEVVRELLLEDIQKNAT